MDLSSILVAIIIMLLATAICVVVFQRLGFGAILGFICAGIIIGPYTPGAVPIHAVDELQSIAELGVVFFMFTVGLEMRPEKVWKMRKLIFGLGSAQMLVTAVVIASYLIYFTGITWESATILGLGMAMSSTAIVMATLGEKNALGSEHGQSTFAVLMAQDLWIVPIMALVPILAHQTSSTVEAPLWHTIGKVIAVLSVIIVIGRYLLPFALSYCARNRQMNAFGIILFLAVISAAWVVDEIGISMTLGAFLLGMLLSASEFRFQIAASIAPLKESLMGLFFIAVGMSINIGAIVDDWLQLLIHVPIVIGIKILVLMALMSLFRASRAAAIRTSFYLAQVGEFAFVLLGAALVAGLLSQDGHTLVMLVVAISMIVTPAIVKLGDALANRMVSTNLQEQVEDDENLDRHVVIVGYDEVGQLISLMLEKANVPYIAFDLDIKIVRKCHNAGRNVKFGNMYNPVTQHAAKLTKAKAIYVTLRDIERAKALAITLTQLYPNANVYVRVNTLTEQDQLVAQGVQFAGTGYIESTLLRGSRLLKSLGVPESTVNDLVKTLQENDYAVIRADYSEIDKA